MVMCHCTHPTRIEGCAGDFQGFLSWIRPLTGMCLGKGQPAECVLFLIQHDTAPLSMAEIEARAVRALALRKATADQAAALKAMAPPPPAAGGE
jgi:hypothetical protein